MGIDHRAKLFYGFAISEDVEKKWLMEDKYADPIVYYAQKKGVAFPDLPYVGNKLLYDQYWEKVDKLQKEDCTILIYGSHAISLYAVCIRSSVCQTTSFDCLKIEKIEISANWDDQIKSYCEVMDIPYQQPTWCLVRLCG